MTIQSLTNLPSRPSWDRVAETLAIVGWTGNDPLEAHLENCRRAGERRWESGGLPTPTSPEEPVPAQEESVGWLYPAAAGTNRQRNVAGYSERHVEENAVWFARIEGWHPARLNELMNAHWAARNRRKKADADIIAASMRGTGAPKADCKRRVSLEIVLGPRQRGGDPDCWHKSLLDALVKCGALVNDSPKWCELGPVTYRRAKRKAIIIRLENCEFPSKLELSREH